MAEWRDALPEDLKAEKSLEVYKPGDGEQLIPVPVGLIKSTVEGQKMIGSSLRVPKDDATPEEWNAFHGKLGRPESPDKYAFKKPDKLPQGVVWDENIVKEYSGVAHKFGLTPKQANGLMDFYMGKQIEGGDRVIATLEQGTKALKEDWKEDYDKNVAIAVRAVDELAPPEIKEILNSTGLGNHPAMVKWMADIGKEFLESKITGEGGVILSREEALAKIATIMGDTKGAYFNVSHPEHQKVTEEVSRLYATAYPR
jgi:hypothetical protein